MLLELNKYSVWIEPKIERINIELRLFWLFSTHILLFSFSVLHTYTQITHWH